MANKAVDKPLHNQAPQAKPPVPVRAAAAGATEGTISDTQGGGSRPGMSCCCCWAALMKKRVATLLGLLI